jgi:tight adherence protein C
MADRMWIALLTGGGIVAAAAVVGILVARRRARRRIVLERLHLVDAPPPEAESIRRRPEEGAGRWASGVLDFFLIGFLRALYRPWMRRAGFRTPHAASVFVLGKTLAMAGAVAALFSLPPEMNPVVERKYVPIVALIAAGAIWIVADVLLYLRVKRRRMRIETDIPFWLDLHATLVEGGMGFDQALSRFVAETELFRRPLFVELRYMYQEMTLGASRLAALKSMADRIDVEALDTVVASIVQGDQIGGGITDTLRAQADMMRNKVFEEARERAQKLPVKLLFPMVVGILPSLFLVTVAPAILRLLRIFEGKGG